MPKLDDMAVPYTYEGQGISPNNEVLGAVIIEKMRSGVDPLQGTGLTYGEHLKYDVSPFTPAAPGASPGTPETPKTSSGSGSGDPYAGMGKF